VEGEQRVARLRSNFFILVLACRRVPPSLRAMPQSRCVVHDKAFDSPKSAPGPGIPVAPVESSWHGLQTTTPTSSSSEPSPSSSKRSAQRCRVVG
jgi:hypothetical protein